VVSVGVFACTSAHTHATLPTPPVHRCLPCAHAVLDQFLYPMRLHTTPSAAVHEGVRTCTCAHASARAHVRPCVALHAGNLPCACMKAFTCCVKHRVGIMERGRGAAAPMHASTHARVRMHSSLAARTAHWMSLDHPQLMWYVNALTPRCTEPSAGPLPTLTNTALHCTCREGGWLPPLC